MLTIEQHLLQKLSEECVEISKEISKAILFGLQDKEPNQKETNQVKIENEIADFLGVIELLIGNSVIREDEIYHREKITNKKDKVIKWMNYSTSIGITEENSRLNIINKEQER